MTEPAHDPNAAAERGARAYNPFMLTIYDTLVLGLVCRYVWRAPRTDMQELYDHNISDRHLELGPGTGYFLRHYKPLTRLALVDLNPQVLAHSARTLTQHRPETYRRNVLRPLDIEPPRFDSIGLNFLMHCIPGDFADKAVVFDHAAAVAAPGCRIFGSTLLGHREPHPRRARLLMATLNRVGVLANTADTLHDLDTQLARRFTDYQLTTHGSVAFFQARYEPQPAT
ncbi:class I SAM-dependent methyltransferase [Nocardia thraciensis]